MAVRGSLLCLGGNGVQVLAALKMKLAVLEIRPLWDAKRGCPTESNECLFRVSASLVNPLRFNKITAFQRAWFISLARTMIAFWGASSMASCGSIGSDDGITRGCVCENVVRK